MKCFISILLIFCAGFGCGKKEELPRDRSVHTREIVIYYFNWMTETYRGLSCSDLKGSSDSVIVLDATRINKLTQVLQSADLVTMPPDYKRIDVRICCLFRGSGDTVLHRLSFEVPPLMELDGRIYRRDSTLFEAVVSFLPKGYLTGELQ